MVETFRTAGLSLILAGVVVTIVPVVICFWVGRYLLKLNAALLLGAVTGAMTSTGALRQVTLVSQSSLPTLGYVGTYTFANVLLAIAGALVVRA